MYKQPEFRPQRPSQLRKAAHRSSSSGGSRFFHGSNFRKLSKIFAIFLVLLFIFAIYKTFTHQSSPEMIERDFINHSAYREIDTRHFEQKSSTHDILIEYPITKYKKINKFLHEKIDAEHQDFMEFTKKSPADKQAFSEKISYQIPRQTDDFLSITISILQDWQGAHPTSRKLFWTFDKKTENVIKIDQITNNRSEILSKIKQEIIAKNQNRAQNINRFLNESLTADKIDNFVAATDATINFPFGKGTVLPESVGEVDVVLNVAEISNSLQTDWARKIFNLPPKAEVSQPAPQIKTATIHCHNCVALTFDDGPGAHTDRLLDILKQQDAKATFFILGPAAQKFPQTTKRITDEGHTAANHSWTHSQFSKLDKAQTEDEITRTNQAIKATGAKLSPFFRPPYGIFNQTTIDVLKDQKMSIAMWNVDPRDWADRNSNLICQRSVTNAGSGSVILLHDIHKTSVDAVGCIISGLKNRGYKLVNFDEMFPNVSPAQVIYRAN